MDDDAVGDNREQDEQTIAEYLATSGLTGYNKLNSGIYMRVVEEGTGDLVGEFPIVEATMQLNVLTRSRTDTLRGFVYQPGITDLFTGGGLSAVSNQVYAGGIYEFIFPSNFAFQQGSGKIESVFIEPGDIIQLRMSDIEARTVSQQNTYEIEQLRSWAEDNGHQVPVTFPSGLTIITVEEGPDPDDLPDPSGGNNYQVAYKGMLLNGTVFDESARFEFNSLNNVIEGWRLGIPQLAKGEKALLLIPSDLAYGSSGNQAIPPYSPLIFEVTLLDF
jgi:FKBP-type peptidyl-prolyl cis-trans isomerase